MRVIKHPDGYQRSVECIVGEMLNLEIGSIVFKNGVRVPDDQIGPRNYPSISTVDYEIKVRVGSGVIFASVDKPKTFIDHIRRVYMVLAKQLIGTRYEKFYNEYATYQLTPHVRVTRKVNTKLMPPDIREYDTPDTSTHHTPPGPYDGRFRWRLSETTALQFSRDNNISIADHLCSVFYDHNNILTLPHDAFVPMLTPDHCLRNPNVLHTPKPVTLSTYWQPYLYQYKLNKWRINIEFPNNGLTAKVPSTRHHRDIEGVYMYDPSIPLPNKIECIECDAVPIGDHYVTYTPRVTPASTYICAACAHNNTIYRKVIEKGTMLFRRGSTLTPEKYLDITEKSPEIKAIYQEAMENGLRVGRVGVFVGNKYYAVPNIESYLLGGKVDDLPIGIKVIRGVLIS